MSQKNAALQCFGPLYGWNGYAVHARNFFRALGRLLPIRVFPTGTNRKGFTLVHELARRVRRPWRSRTDRVSIGLMQPSKLTKFPGSIRVGYTVFEGTRFPDQQRRGLESVDVIWVPSRWSRRVLEKNGVSSGRISVIPEGVNPAVFHSGEPPLEEYESPDRFTLLSVGKWERRKGHRILIECFLRAFRGRSDVELLLQAHNPFRENRSVQDHLATMDLPPEPRIRVIPPMESNRGMARLYNTADLFVLATRAEGWGLPMVEALACGVPVVATKYGPMAEYLDEEYAFPVPPEGTEPIHDPIAYPKGSRHGHWAVPDPEGVIAALKVAAEHPDRVQRMGRRAEKIISSRWCWKRAARRARRDLRSRGVV